MLLDRIDIDTHGPLRSVELGPFSEHLNVVQAAAGCGKTALVRFVRDSLVRREYPLGMLSSSAGRIVWADRNGLVHCRRETDGTAQGRQTIEFERRGSLYADAVATPIGYQSNPWQTGGLDAPPALLSDQDVAQRTIDLPAGVADGIVTDTAITNLGRVVASAVAAGLDSPDLHRDLPLHHDSMTSAHRDIESPSFDAAASRMRGELADIDAELASLPADRPRPMSMVSLQRRRRELIDAINMYRTDAFAYRQDTNKREELRRLHDHAYDLRVRRDAIMRWLTRLDEQTIDRRDPGLGEGYRYRTNLAGGVWGDQDLQRRVDAFDDQIACLQRVAHLIGVLTRTIQQADAMNTPPWRSPWDADAIAADRYRTFLGAIDHYDNDLWNTSAIDRHWQRSEFDRNEAVGPQYRRRDVNTGVIDARITQTIDEIDAAISSVDPAAAERLRSVRNDVQNIRWNHAIDASHVVGGDRICARLSDDHRYLEQLIAERQTGRYEVLTARDRNFRTSYDAWNRDLNWSAIDRDRQRSRGQLGALESELVETLNRAASLRRSLRQLPIAGNQWLIDDTFLAANADTHFSAASPRKDVSLQRLEAELADVERSLAHALDHDRHRWDDATDRATQLRRRRHEILRRLPHTSAVTDHRHPLAEIASRWLVRLSASTMRTIDWKISSPSHAAEHPVAVRLDGRDENQLSLGQRALAVMAIRMAAASVMAEMGRPVPLVLEIHPAALNFHRGHLATKDMVADRHRGEVESAYGDYGRIGRHNHPVAAALRDYAGGGREGSARQVIILTEHTGLVAQLGRVGARTYKIDVRRTEAAHRPMWKPHYQDAPYRGVHRSAGFGTGDVFPRATRYDDQSNASTGGESIRTHEDINRALDAASEYSQAALRSDANSGHRNQAASSDFNGRHDATVPRTDWAMPHDVCRDGYYYAHQSTTDMRHDANEHRNANGGVTANAYRSALGEEAIGHPSMTTSTGGNPVVRSDNTVQPAIDVRPVSPYFLSVDSPIDQAPSIDAVAASRLRACKVTHVTHLMSRDSNRLSDALGLSHVDASTIRHWQSECRLVTQVPHLRGFDARVLVGCGITTPAQLASIHPTDLLRDVEAFLATRRGQQILLSGSSHELSRLTSWIAAANAGASVDHDFDHDRYEVSDDARRSPRTRVRRRRYRVDADGTRREVEMLDGDREVDQAFVVDSQGQGAYKNEQRPTAGNATDHRRRSSDGQSTVSRHDGSSSRSRRRSTTDRDTRVSSSNRRSSSERTRRGYDSNGIVDANQNTRFNSGDRQRRREDESERTAHDSQRHSEARISRSNERELRFYLNRQDPVVDAPSIGPRMAARLERIGIFTVEDLLTRDAQSIADGLDHRRIDAETVSDWQNQATLVCRVPMLRGHDAQLLVAAEITTPEELSVQVASELLPTIDSIVDSSEGKRIIRGGKRPDLEEVTEWIQYASQNRQLQAA